MTLRIQPHIFAATLLWLLAAGMMIYGVTTESAAWRMFGLFLSIAASTYSLAVIFLHAIGTARDELIAHERVEQAALITSFQQTAEATLTRLVQIVELWMEGRDSPPPERPTLVPDDRNKSRSDGFNRRHEP